MYNDIIIKKFVNMGEYMVGRLELTLDSKEIDYKNSSNLQGVIMENIDNEYADILHTQGYNPYSQYVYTKDNKVIWCINTLDEKAYDKIIQRLLDDKFNEFTIKNRETPIKITEKRIQKKSKNLFLEEFYNVKGDKYYNIQFITPTSFKSNGRYMIFPGLRLMYKSLMKKYSASSTDMDMYDEDTLEQLIESSEITRYRLQSTVFPLEGVVIPSYKGSLSIRLHGNDTISRYARLLFSFGEYSGIGIKSSIGMGALKLLNDLK